MATPKTQSPQPQQGSTNANAQPEPQDETEKGLLLIDYINKAFSNMMEAANGGTPVPENARATDANLPAKVKKGLQLKEEAVEELNRMLTSIVDEAHVTEEKDKVKALDDAQKHVMNAFKKLMEYVIYLKLPAEQMLSLRHVLSSLFDAQKKST
ncbi:unnamed protein product [Ambrosiozyma monospora]|uniref:Unnamed protein product n=1 Tax=Ambrosiozyma monospora TaxID=43982 RepID=A0ACB5T418_AMBMO|nr:unnamed protein product [Ambrosiozyma monospora]